LKKLDGFTNNNFSSYPTSALAFSHLDDNARQNDFIKSIPGQKLLPDTACPFHAACQAALVSHLNEVVPVVGVHLELLLN